MKTTTCLYIVVCCASLSIGMQTKGGRHIFKSNKPENILDVTDFSIYYDVETNETIRKMMPRPWYKPGWLLRFPFRGGRCNCESLKCTCCTGVRIPAFNFDRRSDKDSNDAFVYDVSLSCIFTGSGFRSAVAPRIASCKFDSGACVILTYEPQDTMMNLEVMMNNETVYKNNYSARNPPPFCIPIPVPYLPPGLVDMCIRLFDINIIDQKLHVCMDMDTRIDKAPVVVLHFDCMDMGFGGVGLSKPSGSISNNADTNSEAAISVEPTQVAYDIYDPVTENYEINSPMFNNTVKYI